MGISDSVVDGLYAVSKAFPTIADPLIQPGIKEKFMWTLAALILFFVMYHTPVIGVMYSASQGFSFLSAITASSLGTLLTVGIGPIILASIFLQLFSVSGIISLDMHSPEGRQKFHSIQKVLTVIIAMGEAYIFASSGTITLVSHGIDLVIFVALQITLGTVILMYLDEILSKYGITSGISLFIAAGVSYSVFAGISAILVGNNGVLEIFANGGAEAFPQMLIKLSPLFATILTFIAVAYGEGIVVHIPVRFNTGRGVLNSIPLQLLYLSNIPVIFASAFILNLRLFAMALKDVHFEVGGVDIVPMIGFVDSTNMLRDGLLYLMSPLHTGLDAAQNFNFLLNGVSPIFQVPEYIHALVYAITLMFLSIIFGIFWAETAGYDTKSMARQLNKANLGIPGFRSDPRLMEKKLEEYIPYLIVAGSALVGLLAAIADIIGALGSGTGILLTVSILYRTFIQVERMGLFEAYPSLKELFE
ncbi:MAG: preprotein translocase subunit SecY [Candidatus Anstonellales archaeon]